MNYWTNHYKNYYCEYLFELFYFDHKNLILFIIRLIIIKILLINL
jgi:hypothetical protein